MLCFQKQMQNQCRTACDLNPKLKKKLTENCCGGRLSDKLSKESYFTAHCNKNSHTSRMYVSTRSGAS